LTASISCKPCGTGCTVETKIWRAIFSFLNPEI
jgi:hypothetical protein